MAIGTHYRVMFSDGVQELAGSQSRSLLKEFVGHESKSGEAVFLDGIAPDDDAESTNFADMNTRQKYEEITSPDLQAWLDLQTPHHEINRQRTLVLPKRLAWGHHFNKKGEIAELSDPKGRTLRQGLKRIFKGEDNVILTALSAASVQRGKDQSAVAPVPFPAGQQLTIDLSTGADGSEDFTAISKDVFARVKELFEQQFAADERIVLVCNPTHKRILIETSGDKIQSRDFVSPAGYFERGELPDIYGVHVIPHPLCPLTSMQAWTEWGVTYNQFDPLESNLGQSAEQRFHYVAYVEEFANAARVDDNRVVQIDVTMPA